jgi:hypothetical protein
MTSAAALLDVLVAELLLDAATADSLLLLPPPQATRPSAVSTARVAALRRNSNADCMFVAP